MRNQALRQRSVIGQVQRAGISTPPAEALSTECSTRYQQSCAGRDRCGRVLFHPQLGKRQHVPALLFEHSPKAIRKALRFLVFRHVAGHHNFQPASAVADRCFAAPPLELERSIAEPGRVAGASPAVLRVFSATGFMFLVTEAILDSTPTTNRG
jgi:hypothetical protein